MLVEILTSILAGGIVGSTYFFQNGGGGNDTKKIEKIAANCGLVSKDGKKIRIYRKSKNPDYVEYVFQMPHGLSSKQFIDKIDHFTDGLNIKRTVLDISLNDLKQINLKENIPLQIKKLISMVIFQHLPHL